VNANLLAFLLIFGLGHHARDPVDPAKGIQLHGRIPCDGNGQPEDLLRIKPTFSAGGTPREFVISRYEVDKCSVETMFQCWHKTRAGFHDTWSLSNAEPSANALVPIDSCYEWGSKEPSQYVLSGWYQESASDSKAAWKQIPVKQVSAQPEVYEFADPSGGTARLEVTR
jgi:hypothetical protein